MHFPHRIAATLAFVLLAPAVGAQSTLGVDYTIELLPKRDEALVTIRLDRGELAPRLDFNLDPKRQGNVRAQGQLDVTDERAIWQPRKGPATMTLVAKINHQRRGDGFDAHMSDSWAIFRGDDLVPALKARLRKGVTIKATLRFKLPAGWTFVDTGWKQNDDGSFRVDNPQRRFDRPVGWVIAGGVGSRRDHVGLTEFTVAAPRGSSLHRLDVLTFLNFVWPSMETAFQKLPPKILLVGAGEPMWRGGLSATNSLFLHADRPLVSENGTSSLLHELVHVITRIRGERNDDWIAEGLAEYYAIELLDRAGGIGTERRHRIREQLRNWSKDVKTLRVRRSTGKVTARAALLFEDLDREIARVSNGRQGLDDVTRALMQKGKVSLDDLRAAAEAAAGGKLRTLDSPLLR